MEPGEIILEAIISTRPKMLQGIHIGLVNKKFLGIYMQQLHSLIKRCPLPRSREKMESFVCLAYKGDVVAFSISDFREWGVDYPDGVAIDPIEKQYVRIGRRMVKQRIVADLNIPETVWVKSRQSILDALTNMFRSYGYQGVRLVYPFDSYDCYINTTGTIVPWQACVREQLIKWSDDGISATGVDLAWAYYYDNYEKYHDATESFIRSIYKLEPDADWV